MSNAKYIGRIGALAVALGVGFAGASTPAVALPESKPDSTALIVGGTTIPKPDDAYVELVRNHFIARTHPGRKIEYVAVTTPEEMWPFTGSARLVGLALGPPSIFGPGGAAWPDEPWWKLSGLFDLTLDQSIQAGVPKLEHAMAKHGNDHLVINGYSQGTVIANLEKRKLAEQYPAGTKAPDIDFVMIADLNLPNGGIYARFPGLYLPVLDWSFNGPAPTATQFDTVEINRQYDWFADFPLYPLNGMSLLNAFLGIVYVHYYALDVSLPADPRKSTYYRGTHGRTDYYFFETQDLPLFGPLRTLGVPEPVIDVVEPFFREIVELGYDRSIPPWERTPARLIPTHDPATVTADLVDAIDEGIENAAALLDSPLPLRTPAVQTTDTVKEVISDVREGVPRDLTAVGSQLPQPPAVTPEDMQANQRTASRELAATQDQINQTIGAVKSVIGNGRTIVRSAGGDHGLHAVTASSARKTPVRDAITKATNDIKKVVTQFSDSLKTALSGREDDNSEDGGDDRNAVNPAE